MKASEILVKLEKGIELHESAPSSVDAIDPEEPMFLLRATDLCSPAALRQWAQLMKQLWGDSCIRATEAGRCATRMQRWPGREYSERR